MSTYRIYRSVSLRKTPARVVLTVSLGCNKKSHTAFFVRETYDARLRSETSEYLGSHSLGKCDGTCTDDDLGASFVKKTLESKTRKPRRRSI